MASRKLDDGWFRFSGIPVIALMGNIIFFNRNESGDQRFGFGIIILSLIGDTTAGGFSDVNARKLPNGWLYFVSVGDFRNAEGNSEEGKGIAPAIYAVNTKQDIDNGKDIVLELAISRF